MEHLIPPDEKHPVEHRQIKVTQINPELKCCFFFPLNYLYKVIRQCRNSITRAADILVK